MGSFDSASVSDASRPVSTNRGSLDDPASPAGADAFQAVLAEAGLGQDSDTWNNGWGSLAGNGNPGWGGNGSGFTDAATPAPAARSTETAADGSGAQGQDRVSVPGPGPASSHLFGLYETAPRQSGGTVPGVPGASWELNRDTGTLSFFQQDAGGGRTLTRSLQMQGDQVLAPNGQTLGRMHADGGFELDGAYLAGLGLCPLPGGTMPGEGGLSPALALPQTTENNPGNGTTTPPPGTTISSTEQATPTKGAQGAATVTPAGQQPSSPGDAFPDRELPRDNHGRPVPDPEATGPHTQLGTHKGRRSVYPQAREFDKNGNPTRDIDFTDHDRPRQHTNPHQHTYRPNPTGGSPQRGPAEPVK